MVDSTQPHPCPDVLHCDPRHADYDAYWSLRAQIYVNGEKQQRVIHVNRREGWAVRYKVDENGRAVVTGDDWAVETIYGEIEFQLKDGDA